MTTREVVEQTDANVNKKKCYVVLGVIIEQHTETNNLCINLCCAHLVLSLQKSSMISLIEVTSLAMFELVEVVNSTNRLTLYTTYIYSLAI